MLDEIRDRIEQEITRLTHELQVELPDRIRIAVEHGDLRENSEYKAALERHGFVGARLNHLQSRMTELSKIDVTAMPYDRVGFGSRVKVYNVAMDEEAEFAIVAGDFMDLDGGEVSMASPIGQGLLGAREGDSVTIALPVGDRVFKVLELRTLPQQLGLAKDELDD